MAVSLQKKAKSFDFTRELPPLSFSPKCTPSVAVAGGAGVVASSSSPADYIYPLQQAEASVTVAAATAQAVVTSITVACRCGVQSMSHVAFTAEHDQNVMPCNRGEYAV
ncbi:hypothetical protein LOAG_04186 [Loa loa]|uniref:Uncharacterized protein n=1 Tax=Loa loa TaxID=7209 RepID=A0A1S0U3G5_LOALO|nr:hypothetical protein LOAG_04186 [Loa loa]EFO24299.1 hypothetical protein LOAG_04186 [Loa loa]